MDVVGEDCVGGCLGSGEVGVHEEDDLLVHEVLGIGAAGAAVVAFVPVPPAARCGGGYNGQGSECCGELHFG